MLQEFFDLDRGLFYVGQVHLAQVVHVAFYLNTLLLCSELLGGFLIRRKFGVSMTEASRKFTIFGALLVTKLLIRIALSIAMRHTCAARKGLLGIVWHCQLVWTL